MKEKGKMEIHNHVINPRSCEDRYLLLANNIAIQGHPAVGLELDIAELEDQLTHQVYKSDPEIALEDSTILSKESDEEDGEIKKRGRKGKDRRSDDDDKYKKRR
ncbi:hypothetical protein L2E82_01390 [Cichorium intybus]|uniref:Uncharacterized protein n=1 Tax=Cichorium intybus TaxID=13427 RepID=A0ACB9GYG7_CICIN|nr:hypothetical protein L2E82_01390 [Cichorium intybus]